MKIEYTQIKRISPCHGDGFADTRVYRSGKGGDPAACGEAGHIYLFVAILQRVEKDDDRLEVEADRSRVNADHPIVKDLPDGWLTPEGELYNVQKVYEGTTVLAHGDNGKAKEPQACVWINTHGEGRIFSTTLGHHNSTMSTKEYLDMLGNAVKWAMAKK